MYPQNNNNNNNNNKRDIGYRCTLFTGAQTKGPPPGSILL
jgi:hypothetical protein